jgi:hypothetical protein
MFYAGREDAPRHQRFGELLLSCAREQIAIGRVRSELDSTGVMHLIDRATVQSRVCNRDRPTSEAHTRLLTGSRPGRGRTGTVRRGRTRLARRWCRRPCGPIRTFSNWTRPFASLTAVVAEPTRSTRAPATDKPVVISSMTTLTVTNESGGIERCAYRKGPHRATIARTHENIARLRWTTGGKARRPVTI